MSQVDFFVSPSRAEFREELQQAFRELHLDDAEETSPADGDALLGVTFTGALSATELEARAEELRTALAALLTGGPVVRYELAGS